VNKSADRNYAKSRRSVAFVKLSQGLVIMKSLVLLDITLCSTVKVNRRFEGTYRLHLPVLRINPPLLATFLTLVSCLAYSSTLKKDALPKSRKRFTLTASFSTQACIPSVCFVGAEGGSCLFLRNMYNFYPTTQRHFYHFLEYFESKAFSNPGQLSKNIEACIRLEGYNGGRF
jgi:hypothetical protein